MNAEVIIILILIGIASGVLSGLVGVGGGIIIVPSLIFFLGYSQHEAQGTSLGLLLLPIGILAVLNYYKSGYIDIKAVAVMTFAFVVGGWLGSKLAVSISEDNLKKIFAVILFYTAIRMLDWDTAFLKWIKGIF
ncbi:MAG: sulfite exporter TauE/SafE family protein [Bacteroidetes bacterium]|nr:sulfite exporter TauE/SafE family protein [Bacteroidota bacterium]MBS1631224.1 sulfite exporter TauE/SafE family protein [Bacteroidota bacterium]